MLRRDLINMLVCPQTRQRVELVGEEALVPLNEAIRAGKVVNRSGRRLERTLPHAMVRADGLVLYPVLDGIPAMLIDEGVLVESTSAGWRPRISEVPESDDAG